MIPRGFDLNLLLTFEAVNEARSVSGAAERLGVRQPTVSAALARLRALVGDELFVRAGGAMQPTAKALRIAPSVTQALAQLRETLSDAAPFAPKAARRSFTLASTDYSTIVLLPRLLKALKQEAPSIDLRVLGYDKDDVPSLIDRGLIDLALGVFPDPPERAVRQALYADRFVGIARSGHPILADRPVSLENYAAANHALVTLRRDATGEIDRVLRQRGLTRRVALTLPHVLALPAMLRCSDLIAAMPERAAKLLCVEGLEIFKIPLNLAEWRLEMLWNPSARSDQASAWFRAKVAEAARSLNP